MEEIETVIEPNQYFADLKTKFQSQGKNDLVDQLASIEEQIVLAEKIGQKNFLHTLSFSYKTIAKEIEAVAAGYTTFCYEDDIKLMIEKVEPRGSIRIIELERFPRAIPVEELKKIQRAQEHKIFDDFVVIYTDLTNSSSDSIKTAQEKTFVERNRDPVVFGFFKNTESGHRFDRFYLIADWVDDYCDLNFSNMIKKMTLLCIKNPVHSAPIDKDLVKSIVEKSMIEMKTPPRFSHETVEVKKPKGTIRIQHNLKIRWVLRKFFDKIVKR